MYDRDPIWKALAPLAYAAQPMTPELFEAMRQGFLHAPIRPEVRSAWGRARSNHDEIRGFYRAVKLT